MTAMIPRQADDQPASMAASMGLNMRQHQFCLEYLVDGNGTQAAIRAGYAPRSAHVAASRLIRNDKVMAMLASLQAARAGRVQVTSDDVLRRLVALMRADPTHITGYHVVACRYCHGIGHRYQWRTRREYEAACAQAREEGKPLPSADGGFGYRHTHDPNLDCPECDGYGTGQVVHADTRFLTPVDASLIRSVEQTRHGPRIRLADRQRAIELIGRHLGMFNPPPAPKPAQPTGVRVIIVPAKIPASRDTSGGDAG